jgi:hypothetical protein
VRSLKDFAFFIGVGVVGMLAAGWAAATSFVRKTPQPDVGASFRARVAQAKAERDAAATPPTQD